MLANLTVPRHKGLSHPLPLLSLSELPQPFFFPLMPLHGF